MTVRPARPGDGAAVAALHNPVIRETAVTFTDAERRAEEVDRLIAGGRPHWIAERAGAPVGFATLFQFRGGPGYARSFEHTVIVAPEAQGRGAGRALMAALEAGARGAGGHTLFAGVSGGNQAGVAFHAALGFAEVARLREVGWKFGRFHDLVLMQKMLGG
ncbi:MAG: GNAT family N-acetyltransferase [Deinococcus-Thermus bacterium]|nr:GNAT family N-acetyltransferase [Deinococcota bacterium]